jgi:uncharacterized protein YjbI with pentapeptide repeats
MQPPDPAVPDPPAQAPSTDDPEARQRELALRKLQAETAMAEHQARRIEGAERLKVFGAVLPALTVLVSVLGLMFSLRAQVQQQKRSDADRREDQFTSAVRDFAAGPETAQLAALVRLERFWDEPAIRQRLIDLLLASVGTVPSVEVRSGIQQQLLRHADLDVLSSLAAQNRRIADELRERRHGGPFVERYVLPAAWVRVASDTADRAPFERLAWNIATLIPVMNRIRDIHDVDLSDVVLSRTELTVESDTAEPSIRRLDRPDPAPGLSFSHVSLRGAVLSGIFFRNVKFSAVNLDSATLAEVMFDSCSFSHGTSLASFRPWVSFQVPGGPPLRTLGGTQWLASQLDVANFYPQFVSHRKEHSLAEYMMLMFTSWNVANAPPPGIATRLGRPLPLHGTVDDTFPTWPMRPR